MLAMTWAFSSVILWLVGGEFGEKRAQWTQNTVWPFRYLTRKKYGGFVFVVAAMLWWAVLLERMSVVDPLCILGCKYIWAKRIINVFFR